MMNAFFPQKVIKDSNLESDGGRKKSGTKSVAAAELKLLMTNLALFWHQLRQLKVWKLL